MSFVSFSYLSAMARISNKILQWDDEGSFFVFSKLGRKEKHPILYLILFIDSSYQFWENPFHFQFAKRIKKDWHLSNFSTYIYMVSNFSCNLFDCLAFEIDISKCFSFFYFENSTLNWEVIESSVNFEEQWKPELRGKLKKVPQKAVI